MTFLIFKQRVEIGSTLVSTKLIWPMLLELLVSIIHSPPGMNNVNCGISTTGSNPVVIQVDLELIISILVPLRVFLLFRYFSLYSSWADDRAEKICNECNANGGVTFAIKAELKERPYIAVGTLMILSILIFGYGLRNVEVAFMQNVTINKFQDWRYIWNGLWCIVITILTVGYGDYYPQTHLGRAIAVVACLWGTFLISLMVVSMTNSVDFTPQEEKAYDEIKKDDMHFKIKHKALMMIRHCVQLKNVIDLENDSNSNLLNDKEYTMKYKQALTKYKKSLGELRSFRKYVISREHEISTETIINKLNQCVTEDVEDLINMSQLHVVNLIEHIKWSKHFQEQIKTYVSTLEKLTSGLHACVTPELDKLMPKTVNNIPYVVNVNNPNGNEEKVDNPNYINAQ